MKKYILFLFLFLPLILFCQQNCDNWEERECLRKIYYSQIDVRELTGSNDGYEVETYLGSTGLGKGNPWCAAFVYWCFLQCKDTLAITSPAWSPSYFNNEHNIYLRGEYSRRPPQFGDLAGFYYSEKGRIAHIEFFDGENPKYYFTVGGNTNGEGSNEGDGVYRKKRPKRTIYAISSWF